MNRALAGTEDVRTLLARASCIAPGSVLVKPGLESRPVKKWQCIVCGWIYDEAEGCEYEDIPPGTPWEDVPDDFVCPECGVGKEDFEMIEVG